MQADQRQSADQAPNCPFAHRQAQDSPSHAPAAAECPSYESPSVPAPLTPSPTYREAPPVQSPAARETHPPQRR